MGEPVPLRRQRRPVPRRARQTGAAAQPAAGRPPYAAGSAGEALVRLRAIQAGLLREGLLLHHHNRPGDAGLGHRLTPAAVSAINRTLSTQNAAAAVLYLLFPFSRRDSEAYWHPGDMTDDSISPSARDVTIEGIHLPVPAHARAALLAHVTFRRLLGGKRSTLLFEPRDPRRMAERALAGTSSAHQMSDDDLDPSQGHGTLWMRQTRLGLRNLVGTGLSLDLTTPTWT
jgi:hypothetical protein